MSDVVMVALGAGGFLGLLCGWAMHHIQHRELEVLPVLYSGVERLRGATLMVQYYAAVNDLVMAVAQSWNNVARRRGFASFLASMRTHHVDERARAVLHFDAQVQPILKTHARVYQLLRSTEDLLGSAWDYRSKDNYRTETYTETYTDGNGKKKTRRRTRRVYEDTDHWFSFFSEAARHAEVALGEALQLDAMTLFDPKLENFRVLAAQQDAGASGPYRAALGAGDAEEERRLYQETVLEDPSASVEEHDLEQALNQWLIRADVENVITSANADFMALCTRDAHGFEEIHGSQASYHFNTSSRSHRGPEGYQVTQRLRGELREIVGPLARLFLSMQEAHDYAEDLVSEFAAETNEPWNRERAKDALDQAITTYVRAFPDSTINMDQRPRWSRTALVGFVGFVLGAAVVAGLYSLRR